MVDRAIFQQVFDHIVVGAGIEGLSTAARLVQLGRNVLLVEQFALFHTRGSSNGLSRITRLAYNKPEYVALVQESLNQWKQLEKEFGSQLYRETGVLAVGHENSAKFVGYEKSMKHTVNIESRRLNNEELKKEYGSLLYPPEGYKGFWESEGGLLYANRCLQAYLKRFLGLGGKLVDKSPVVDIEPGSTVSLTLEGGARVRGKSVVLTMGPWTPQFLREKLHLPLPVEVLRTFACYWREQTPGLYHINKGVPTVLCPEDDAHYFFKPVDEYPGLLYFGLHIGVPVNPDTPAHVDSRDYLDKCRKFADKLQLKIDTTQPAVMEPCFYQESIDGDYILDFHPAHKNIVFGTGFSGHGFKLAPVIGDILARLALGQKSEHYRDIFSCERFEKKQLLSKI